MSELERDDPTHIGDYEIVARLGLGSMGIVYKAWNLAGTPVAVKVISRHFAREEKYRQRFLVEATTAQSIPKFCTAQVLDSSMNGDQPFIVTEYVPGPTLLAEVSRGTIEDSALDAVAVGVAAALTAIHKAGVVHRDLKPANILLSAYGPRVIDFGLSSILDAARLTSSGVAVGTASFMAPEQACGGPADPKSDIYSWATTIVYAATGRPPTVSASRSSWNARYDKDAFENSPALERMVTRCLDWEPANRPTAAELLDSLAALAPSTLASAVDHDVQRPHESRPRTADQWAAKARQSLASERFRLALFDAEQGITVDPHHAKCWLQKGVAQVQLGRVEEGEDALRLAFEMDSDDPEILTQYSSTLVNSPRKEARALGFSIAPHSPDVRRAFIEHLKAEDDDTLWSRSIQTTKDPEIVGLYRRRTVKNLERLRREAQGSKRRVHLASLSLTDAQSRQVPYGRTQEARKELEEAENEHGEVVEHLLRTSSQAYLTLPNDTRVRQTHGSILVQESAETSQILHGFSLARSAEDIVDQLISRCLRDPNPNLLREVLSSVDLTDSEILRVTGTLYEENVRIAAPYARTWDIAPRNPVARALNIEKLAELCLRRIDNMDGQDETDVRRRVEQIYDRAFAAYDDQAIKRALNTLASVAASFFLVINAALLLISFLTSNPFTWFPLILLFPLVSLLSFGAGTFFTPDKRRRRRRLRLLKSTALTASNAYSPTGPIVQDRTGSDLPLSGSLVVESVPVASKDDRSRR